DTYRFARGDGNDGVSDPGGNDAIELGAGILPSDVLVRNARGSMVLSLGANDSIIVGGGFAEFTDSAMEELRFADGSIWNLDRLRSEALRGTPNDDIIEGFDSFGSTFDGGAGNDTLMGGFSDDTFVFGRGYGFDLISDAGGFDTLRFASGLNPGDVDFSVGGSDLQITIRDTGESVTVAGWLGPHFVNDSIESFRFANG